jgi:cyclopropane-fatty-acyl-phospholipid synthase
MLETSVRAVRNAVSVTSAEPILRDWFASAGIQIDGTRPFDLRVHDGSFYARVLRDGALGLGESYMDGHWDCEALDVLVAKMLDARLNERVPDLRTLAFMAAARLVNLQTRARAFEVADRHYDLGNDLYEAMLDRRLAYTCGYWKGARDLDEAQEAKLDLVCRKIGLRQGMRVLDLGCGWGCFARFAAERYGARVTGYTISSQQVALGRKLCAGLPVEIVLDDYRNAQGSFDAVLSIGILEHVGCKNYSTYMQVVDRCLAPGGVALVHTIGANRAGRILNLWFHKYIFPNAVLPSLAQITAAMEGRFVPEDVHNIGPDYDPTLMAWHANFERAWPSLRARYGERFRRMWRFYLLSCAGAFRARYVQLYQIVATRQGTPQPACRLT